MRTWQGKSLTVKILYTRAGVGQHIWINTKKVALLFDSGDGVLRDILSHKLHPKQIKAIVYTHGHFDHMGGLHTPLGYMRMVYRKEALLIYSPKGCREVLLVIKNFQKIYKKTIPFKILYKELKPKKPFYISGMRIIPYPVRHHGSVGGAGILGPLPAFGYRISYKGESIAITGDTGFCSVLIKLVKNASLAIIEVTYKKYEGKSEHLKKVHLSEHIAKKLGKIAKEFILVHKVTKV